MATTPSSDRISITLWITNILILVFWLVYFANGILPTYNSVEIVKDFDEFSLAGPGSTSYKKMVTPKRNFTVYTNESEFFTNDTLELKLTPIFGLVLEYRRSTPGIAQPWIRNRLSRYTNTLLLAISMGLFLLAVSLVLFKMKITLFKTLCLLSAIGTLIFLLSVIT